MQFAVLSSKTHGEKFSGISMNLKLTSTSILHQDLKITKLIRLNRSHGSTNHQVQSNDKPDKNNEYYNV